jgi:glycosyltransferase involved in cell wall biosynthesis
MTASTPLAAVVVPTLGRRPEFLDQSLRSIREAGESYVLLVAPAAFDASELIAAGLADQKIDETGTSLPAAIDQGFDALPESIRYIGWLGDDDLLRPGALSRTQSFLEAHPKSSAVYGACDYVDENGAIVWANRSGAWAAPLLRVGPDLIPQPGSLFRRTSYREAGKLRTDLGWAFDLDLFLRLARVGKLSYLRETLAAFRWHADSLSVGRRGDSVREASQVRREFLPGWARPLSVVWEGPVRWATHRAGDFVGGGKKK